MTNLNIISKKFFSELRNGVDFSLNLSDYTTDIRGNVGERLKLNCVFEIETFVLGSDVGSIHVDMLATKANFTGNVAWFDEGIDNGSVIDIIWNGGTNIAQETVTSATNVAGGILQTTNGNLLAQGLTTSDRTDFEFRVVSTPDKAWFKYGINKLQAPISYISPLDNNEQSFWQLLTTSFQPMNKNGNYNSWVMGNVEMKINSSVGYVHQYEFNHIFTIPYFKDVELGNILNNQIIQDLQGNNTYRYDFGIYLGTQQFTSNIKKDVQGISGNVGWYNENFNGFTNNYEVLNVYYTNTYGTQTIEATDTNTLTFQVKKLNGNFTPSVSAILKHSKLPSSQEYSDSSDTFDTIWMTDSLYQTVGQPVVNSTTITNLTITANADPTLIDVSCDISYSTQQQNLIDVSKYFLLSLVIEDETLVDAVNDRVNLIIDANNWNKDTDTYGLILFPEMRFFKGNIDLDAEDIANGKTDFKGWDSDLVGVKFKFNLDKTPAIPDKTPLINSLIFRLIAYNTVNGNWFEIDSIPITFDPNNLLFNIYQQINVDYNLPYNLPVNESFNRVKFKNVDVSNSQSFQGQLSFKVNWRDWIANQNVDNVFYDSTKQNNNKNKKTSNYSNLNDYKIYGALDIDVKVFNKPNTTYRLLSYDSDIYDFDIEPSNAVIASITLLDANGNIIPDVYSNEDVTIEILFIKADSILYGEIIIEENGTQLQEHRLSTSKRWDGVNNLLKSTSINGLVDIVYIDATKIKLVCKTKKEKIDPNKSYNIYGRLYEID